MRESRVEHMRDHQNFLMDYLNDNVAVPKILTMHVTPGGGKSWLPYILLDALRRKKIAKKLAWITPRTNLKNSAAEAGLKETLKMGLGTNFEIMESTNEHNPSRGCDGFVTTYQAIGCDAAHINKYEMHRERYCLVLDEVHHVKEGGCWHRALQPLVDEAKFILCMTGFLFRGDGAPIAFLPYTEVENVACR